MTWYYRRELLLHWENKTICIIAACNLGYLKNKRTLSMSPSELRKTTFYTFLTSGAPSPCTMCSDSVGLSASAVAAGVAAASVSVFGSAGG